MIVSRYVHSMIQCLLLVGVIAGCSSSSETLTLPPSDVVTQVPTQELTPTITMIEPIPPTLSSQEIEAIRKKPGEPVPFWTLNMKNKDVGWATAAWGLYRTEDGGRGWVDITPPDHNLLDENRFLRAETAFPDAETAWVSLTDPNNPLELVWVWVTQDGGKHWIQSTPIDPIPGQEIDLFVQAVDENTGWLLVDAVIDESTDLHISRLFRTNDGGQSWMEENLDVNRPTDMIFLDPLRGMISEALGQDGKMDIPVWITQDGGKSWKRSLIPPPSDSQVSFEDIGYCDQVHLSSTSDTWISALVACSQRERLMFRTSDFGANWGQVKLPSPSDGMNGVIWFDGQSGYQIGRDMYQTEDGGETWQRFKSVNWNGIFSFSDPRYGWVFAESGPNLALVYTQDSGLTWEILEPKFIARSQ